MVVLYKSIDLLTDGTAERYLSGLLSSFEGDDKFLRDHGRPTRFKEHVKHHVFAIGTDGALVMTGAKNGLW